MQKSTYSLSFCTGSYKDLYEGLKWGGTCLGGRDGRNINHFFSSFGLVLVWSGSGGGEAENHLGKNFQTFLFLLSPIINNGCLQLQTYLVVISLNMTFVWRHG